MDNKYHQEYLQNEVKPKFRSSQSIKSKAAPRYPESVEREFQRLSRQYLGIFKDTLKDQLPAIMNAYKKERHGSTRLDDSQDLNNEVQEEMRKTAEEGVRANILMCCVLFPAPHTIYADFSHLL